MSGVGLVQGSAPQATLDHQYILQTLHAKSSTCSGTHSVPDWLQQGAECSLRPGPVIVTPQVLDVAGG